MTELSQTRGRRARLNELEMTADTCGVCRLIIVICCDFGNIKFVPIQVVAILYNY